MSLSSISPKIKPLVNPSSHGTHGQTTCPEEGMMARPEYSQETIVDFNITIPEDLPSACGSGGKCALQWYWWSNSNSQTYESCIDFYVNA
ncbi:hypothetical protein diail_11018 [Diaporthe ilicicola]|nr:hypothetical protein diail_11018 [Diaporthe ilicicola]